MTAKKFRTKLLAASITPIIALLIAWRIWSSLPGYEFEAGFWVVEDAYVKHHSNLMVEVNGTVVRLLSDEKSNDPVQRFVIVLRNGQRVTMIHDLGQAERVPVNIDDDVTARGEYIWTEPGGLIRGTHWDPYPTRLHGWIDHDGIRYE